MKCEVCHGNTSLIPGQQYEYTESGLENVCLTNVEMRACEACGERTPRLPRVLELHANIARHIALQPMPLRGADIRFLRKQLGMRAREWAGLLRIDVSTFSRWENDEQRPGPQSDALIRFIYFYEAEVRENRSVPDRLAEQIASVSTSREEGLSLVIDVQTHQAVWRRAGQGAMVMAAVAGSRVRRNTALPTGQLIDPRQQIIGEAPERASRVNGSLAQAKNHVRAA